ncbi:hypothetical protein C9413_28485 [Rhizobium sp. SEMIA 4085]|uniref:Rop-like family nitrogen fixation protein n=1 Tax=Rhizobium gallicum bv. gallicum R602sp TaxID=1041138 RepID=A0A0B4X6Z6_9HYPH|nr:MULTISPECIES: CCE_0567 family metalloprotein [Rhizobium]AJD43824.1 Rop-like family nitrogen fixation protein [Rhizobium gallicum bv. gallicum R602sp]NNH33216.1 hypothetical protein [Rhizobium sp. SEMIA 4085]TDW34303.1 hypothetical protein EV128_104310 [Rhizobium azibense]
MSNLEEQLKKVRKLQSRAATAKMELHDLAEDLPINWTRIKTVARKTFDAFAELESAKEELSTLENSR